jgi:hypothetical protein
MIINRRAFLREIRELGYTYKRQTKRTQIYQKRGTDNFIFVPPKTLTEEYVRQQFARLGFSKEEVDAFALEHGSPSP